MPKKKKIEWEEVAKKGENLELILIDFVKEGFDLFFKSKEKKYPQGFFPTYYRQFAGARWLIKREINQFINRMKNKEAQNPGFIFKGYLKYEDNLNKFRQYSGSLLGQEVKDKTISQLIAFVDKLRKQYGKMFAYSYNYYLYNRFLPDQLVNILAKKEKDLKLQAKYFEILVSLDRPSETREEKEALLRLVTRIKKEHLNLKNKRVSWLIEKHLAKFAQFGFYYFRGRPLTERDIKKRIKQWSKKDYKQELKNIAKQKQNAKESQKIMTKLKFNKKEKILVKTLKQMAFCVQLFDENYNYFTYCSHPLWCKIANRLGITYNQLIWMRAEEIKDYLEQREKISMKLKAELKQRAKDHALIWEKGKTRLLVGKKLRQYYKQELVKEKHIKVKEIKGQPASAGKAEGRVALVLDVKEIGKVKKGNIMVTPETVPSYVPAMEKAVAIVTDMGGLLSHAAIVSRELGIPCVVGTKIGTKVLKDGDRVEVDATKGSVKKLNK